MSVLSRQKNCFSFLSLLLPPPSFSLSSVAHFFLSCLSLPLSLYLSAPSTFELFSPIWFVFNELSSYFSAVINNISPCHRFYCKCFQYFGRTFLLFLFPLFFRSLNNILTTLPIENIGDILHMSVWKYLSTSPSSPKILHSHHSYWKHCAQISSSLNAIMVRKISDDIELLLHILPVFQQTLSYSAVWGTLDNNMLDFLTTGWRFYLIFSVIMFSINIRLFLTYRHCAVWWKMIRHIFSSLKLEKKLFLERGEKYGFDDSFDPFSLSEDSFHFIGVAILCWRKHLHIQNHFFSALATINSNWFLFHDWFPFLVIKDWFPFSFCKQYWSFSFDWFPFFFCNERLISILLLYYIVPQEIICKAHL